MNWDEVVGGVQKVLPDQNNFGILWSNFQFLYKEANHQHLTIFDQIKY